METIANFFAIVFVLLGAFFMLVGSIGVNRFPDFYTRAHASGKVDTLGIMLFILGLMFFEGFNLISLKLLLIAVFVAMTSPVAAHALARRALVFGVKPWTREKGGE
ncbi:monovalent cation/H(+) antiporter subunit G [Desulfonatronovibrio hydrogenovorans]|uniref:monovalent cation/H(+) antiporter subunit G n=1 Tax=Desulfonatronovibrio hydrogenovorans TaxID=53245 RepID=UPI00048E1837|nr:monovalent cation/H(+) antiporter subunit G [Desulfonatronovibrio hydrogenovorans]